jgi:hypothetical protein
VEEKCDRRGLTNTGKLIIGGGRDHLIIKSNVIRNIRQLWSIEMAPYAL